MRTTTSMRLPEDLREALASAARQEGLTVTALVERYAREGLAIDRHPGVVFKPGPSGRRAALAGGPDVWEVVAALQATPGSERERVEAVADALQIHPNQVVIALEYAADHRAEITERIEANEVALAEAERIHQARRRLLDSA